VCLFLRVAELRLGAVRESKPRSLLSAGWPRERSKSSYPPFLAWIEVDGKRVSHYKSEGDGKEYSAYIESTVGAPWALCYKPLAESPEYDFTVEGWVDGER